MKHYEEYEYTETHRRIVKVTCDRCGQEIEQPDCHSAEIRQFSLAFAKGEYDSDGGDYKEGWKVFDLCDGCVGWLHQMLLAEGVGVSEVDEMW